MRTVILAALLAVVSSVAYAQPRHIYRDGNYFFCPDPGFDPYCALPNDYSAALHHQPSFDVPPEGRPGPPVLLAPGLPPALGALADRAIRNALRPRYQAPPAPPPQMSMEQEREAIIRQGEEHCRRFPQDTQVCHPPKQ